MLKVHRAKEGVVSNSNQEDEGFTVVISTSKSSHSCMWNSLELYAIYIWLWWYKKPQNFDLLDYFGNIVVKEQLVV